MKNCRGHSVNNIIFACSKICGNTVAQTIVNCGCIQNIQFNILNTARRIHGNVKNRAWCNFGNGINSGREKRSLESDISSIKTGRVDIIFKGHAKDDLIRIDVLVSRILTDDAVHNRGDGECGTDGKEREKKNKAQEQAI
ncbi:MAG: hypothetical protein ACLFQ6_09055 [Candidatus Sumerlaeia bacterium]